MKKTWKHKVRPLVDLGSCLGVPLNDGTMALIDYRDRGVVEGWNWSIDGKETRVGRGRNGKRLALASAILGQPRVDHRSGDIRDNRRGNLRPATSAQNARNRRIGRANKSGFKGVSFRKDRGTWLAAIGFDGKLLKLGTFATPADAARAYDAAALTLFGDFAVLNFKVDKFPEVERTSPP